MNGMEYRAKRRHMRLSMQYVANQLGISRHTLANYETGKSSMPVTVFIRLNRLYGFDSL